MPKLIGKFALTTTTTLSILGPRRFANRGQKSKIECVKLISTQAKVFEINRLPPFIE